MEQLKTLAPDGVQAAFIPGARSFGADRGATLLNWTTDHSTLLPRPKHTLLPLLTVLFLISYGLMALLVVEQGRTIDSQRNLIRQLFGDSTQLTTMKGQAIQKQRAEAQAQSQPQADPKAQTQTPPSQVTPRDNGKSEHNAGKFRKPLPPKPPRDTSDTSDERRVLFSI